MMINETVLEAINIMWQGMAGILVVMAVLSGVVALLGRMGNRK